MPRTVERTKRARLRILKVGVLAATLVLASAVCCNAGQTAEPARTIASRMPVKAPPRPKRPARPARNWDFSTPAWGAAARPYTFDVASQHVKSLALDLTVLAVASIYIGVDQWGWGETPFHFYREGWFGKNTAYGGVDKFGHAWTAHLMSDYMTWRLESLGFEKFQSSVTAALITGVAFLGVELGDGFSHYGASYEDFVASAVGISFSFLRTNVPGLAEKVDFRMEYLPTGHGDTFGLGDYSGKKFLLAWKFAGFEPFKEGPLRYLELHTGYYTRGYNEWERAAGIPQSRSPYVGLGLNLSELVFGHPSVRDTLPGSVGRTILKYIQPPYTYISSGGSR